MTDPETPTVQRAVPQLLDLLAAMRPDWPDLDVRGVVTNAAQVGITWEQTCVGLVRLAIDPDARPGELIPDHRDPTLRRRRDPDLAHRGAAQARELLATTREDDTP